MSTLICDCNRTIPLDAKALGQSLREELTLHSSLCRRQAAAFQQAIESGQQEVVVACTQEQRLFTELAGQSEGAVAPLRFVNIRETGGWGRDAQRSGAKIAALLAAAHLPEPAPVATVGYQSAGRLLIIGALDQAERAADLLGDTLTATLFTQGPGAAGGAQTRRYPVLGGRITALSGWLGAFDLQWQADNPIDLDLCTRCNACIAACPENAIALDYQIDLAACRSHRACVQACQAAGAIDFERAAAQQQQRFDLVLDLRAASARPGFAQHAPPQGYFRGDGSDAATLLALRDLVGAFEKPRFFTYQQKLCAHSRNQIVGCQACVDICSAQAIASDPGRQRIEVNAQLCVGCGACATVCPSGALSYAYPDAVAQGLRIKTLLTSYAAAGGQDAVLLLHSQTRGQSLIEELGRAAQCRAAQGLPANVIPLALWHTASAGIDLWLAALAYGAAQLLVLVTQEEAPQYLDGLQAQCDLAQCVWQALGHPGSAVQLLRAAHPSDLDAALQALPPVRRPSPAATARFAVAQQKRSTLEMAIEQLVEQSPLPAAKRPEAIALPRGAPWGSVEVDPDRCTLCLSCVSACPAGALQDNPLLPQLRFIEKNCVQCGLCARTCPEDAIRLRPRLLLSPERAQPRVLNEASPWACVRCAKPFGTVKAIEAMLGRLAGHAMFQGQALERLKMCSDCRVIDLYSSDSETRVTDL